VVHLSGILCSFLSPGHLMGLHAPRYDYIHDLSMHYRRWCRSQSQQHICFLGRSGLDFGATPTTLEQHIDQVTKRCPRNLLNDRMTLQHQKASDPETGCLLGYARWILPPSHTTTADNTPAWPEALVPTVGREEEAEIRRVAATAIWKPNHDLDELDVPVGKIKNEMLEKELYLRS
jgi:hypothetical protein